MWLDLKHPLRKLLLPAEVGTCFSLFGGEMLEGSGSSCISPTVPPKQGEVRLYPHGACLMLVNGTSILTKKKGPFNPQ